MLNFDANGNATAVSSGSGFVVNSAGYIITNSHVLIRTEPENNFVQFSDGTRRQVERIVERDASHDYAILKIEDEEYCPVELGDFSDCQEGDEVFFCGYPLFSAHHVIHKGIISSKFNDGINEKIQLDASVNSGNSGGPLFSINEKVIGIITEKAGGIDKEMSDISDFVLRAPTIFTTNWTVNGRTVALDPTKQLAKVVKIIHDYTNVGIGYAYSISYVKTALRRLKLIN